MLILASASPRRLDLLRQIGITPDTVIPADIDEAPIAGEMPRLYALRMAEEKAAAICDKAFSEPPRAAVESAFILAADTVVARGRRILPKAANEAIARECLELLSGRSHRVYTAISVSKPGGERRSKIVESRVTVKRLHETEITRYLASEEWRGKAGGYAIQGCFEAYIRQLSGSYSNIVGLPLFEITALLRGLGYHWG